MILLGTLHLINFRTANDVQQCDMMPLIIHYVSIPSRLLQRPGPHSPGVTRTCGSDDTRDDTGPGTLKVQDSTKHSKPVTEAPRFEEENMALRGMV